MTCSKLYITKIKHIVRLRSQRTKGEVKTSFNFAVILCKYLSINGILSSIHLPYPVTTRHRVVTKNYSLKDLTYFVIFTSVYSPLLVPILSQTVHVVNTHTQFKMIGKQSYENDCSAAIKVHSAAIKTLGK